MATSIYQCTYTTHTYMSHLRSSDGRVCHLHVPKLPIRSHGVKQKSTSPMPPLHSAPITTSTTIPPHAFIAPSATVSPNAPFVPYATATPFRTHHHILPHAPIVPYATVPITSALIAKPIQSHSPLSHPYPVSLRG